jgi:hypothetical protein
MALIQEEVPIEIFECRRFALNNLKETTIDVGVQEHPGYAVKFI